MKKILPIFCLIFSLITISSDVLIAQFSAGGGLNYDTDLKRIGFSAKIKYVFDDDVWAASPSYNIYPSDGLTVKIIDLDAHYHLATLFANDVIIYGLGGLGIVNVLDTNKVALNGGFGTSIPTNGDLNIFAEVKFRVNKNTGTQIGGGVLYEF